MKAYVTTSANVTGVFPLTLAKNSSTGTATDGTPIVADYTNDLWPLMQGLMDRCAMTPSGTVEAYVAVGSGNASGQGAFTGVASAQHMQSLAYNFGAPGEIVFDFIQGVNALPATRRVLALTGSIVDGYLYPDLWYNCWCGSAANATAPWFFTSSSNASYAAATAARTTTGMTVNGVTGGRYLVLPDCRGLSPVGLGNNGMATGVAGTDGRSVNLTVYTGGTALGYILWDQFMGHWHQLYKASPNSAIPSVGAGSALPIDGTSNVAYSNDLLRDPKSDGTNGTPRTGAYTRTPGFACNIGIRY